MGAAAANADLARLGGAAARVCLGFVRRLVQQEEGGRGGELEEGGVVVRRGSRGREEEKESDAGGRAVNAMAAMALSLSRPGPAARAGCFGASRGCGGGEWGWRPCCLRFLRSPLS